MIHPNRIWALAALAVVAAPGVHAAPVVGVTEATPLAVPVGASTSVLVTSRILDAAVIPESVTLQNVAPDGTVTNVGILHDDGLNGDVSFGDKLFSLRITVQQSSPVELQYRVSAAFRGVLRRVNSEPFSIYVQATTAPQTMLTQFANALAGPDDNAVMAFLPDTRRSRERLEGLTSPMRTALANALRAATLVKTDGPTRIFSLHIVRPDGVSATTTIGVTQGPLGQWTVTFW